MASNTSVRAIGIVGAGKLGTVLAQLSIKAGLAVYIVGSGDDDNLRLEMSVLAPDAHVINRDELVKRSDMIILALPLSKYSSIPATAFDGKLVIDAMNYWWEVDGDMSVQLGLSPSSSEMVQHYFKKARIVKGLNHVGYHDLYDHATKTGDAQRRAIAVAGDNETDTTLVSQLIDILGFDSMNIGTLRNGKKLEPGGVVFGVSTSKDDLQTLLQPHN